GRTGVNGNESLTRGTGTPAPKDHGDVPSAPPLPPSPASRSLTCRRRRAAPEPVVANSYRKVSGSAPSSGGGGGNLRTFANACAARRSNSGEPLFSIHVTPRRRPSGETRRRTTARRGVFFIP